MDNTNVNKSSLLQLRKKLSGEISKEPFLDVLLTDLEQSSFSLGGGAPIQFGSFAPHHHILPKQPVFNGKDELFTDRLFLSKSCISPSKFNSDHKNRQISCQVKIGDYVHCGDKIGYLSGTPIIISESGKILKISQTQITIQKMQPVLFYSQAEIHVENSEWVKRGAPILTLAHQTLVTGDIVQGIPRIEQLFEASTSAPSGAALQDSDSNYEGDFALKSSTHGGRSPHSINEFCIDHASRKIYNQGLSESKSLQNIDLHLSNRAGERNSQSFTTHGLLGEADYDSVASPNFRRKPQSSTFVSTRLPERKRRPTTNPPSAFMATQSRTDHIYGSKKERTSFLSRNEGTRERNPNSKWTSSTAPLQRVKNSAQLTTRVGTVDKVHLDKPLLLYKTLQSQVRETFRKKWDKLPLPVAVRQSLEEIQQIIVESIQKVYLSQGVLIADKHIEIIVRQMTSKAQIFDGGSTGLLIDEILGLQQIENANISTPGQKALYIPVVMGLTRAALSSDSFVSSASFQETTRVLSRDAIAGKSDFLRGLKEKVIIGDLIDAGTGLDLFYIYSLFSKKIFETKFREILNRKVTHKTLKKLVLMLDK